MQPGAREPSLGGRCTERVRPTVAEAEGVRHTMCTKFEEDMKENALNELGCFIHVAKNINGTQCPRIEHESLSKSFTQRNDTTIPQRE